MSANENLHSAKNAKNDEFYTQLKDVEAELKHYAPYFKDKIVFCNCDDPDRSAFWEYFHLHFAQLGLKKLISTHYEKNKFTYEMEYDGWADSNLDAGAVTLLKGNGDFRSEECVDLLDACDIVVTNPPFSLMSEYIQLLMAHKKKFIVLGNINHITIQGIKEYVFGMQMWLGHNSGHFWFSVPDDHPFHATDYKEDDSGQKWRRMGGTCWFTNLDIKKRHEPLVLRCKYNDKDYPKYDDFDAIECGKTDWIPMDYDGVMGVPVTYLPYHCHDQFEILGIVTPILNGKRKYKRVLIRRRWDFGIQIR